MRTLTLPDNKPIPALGLGTWKSSPGEVYQAVTQALSSGYTHIDCAPAYQNEAEVGKALKQSMEENIISRDELWVTSKLWNNAHHPEHVLPALEQTLLDLQLDYLDLYLIHWPVAFKHEVFFPDSGEDYISLETIPISETWKALEGCAQKGLVKYIGVCNFSIKKLQKLKQGATIQPVMNQVELHPYLQQPEMLEYCRTHNILLTAYSPLGSGDRPAALKKSSEPGLLDNAVINKIATKHGATAAQVLLSWALGRDTVVIPKSVSPARILENFNAQNVVLDQQDMEQIETLDQHYRYVDGSFWQAPGSPYTVAEIWDE